MPECEIPSPLDPDARWPEGLCIRARAPADAPGITALHNMAGFRHGTLRCRWTNGHVSRKQSSAPHASPRNAMPPLDQ